ncbi:MAG: protease inhibitor I42 family protein [Hyphomonadaceae bacterium]
MSIRAIAAAAGLGLLAAACNQPAPTPEPAKPEEKPAPAAQDDAFKYAVGYACEGGGKVEVVYDRGATRDALVRVDGGAAMTLPLNPDSQTGIEYKNADATLGTDGSTIRWTSGGATKVCHFVNQDLPPPAVDGVVRALTVDDAGKSVEMKVGEKISVALSGVPTAGYVWAVSAPPAYIKATEGPGGAMSTAQFTPGFAGGNHWEVIVIEATAKGEGEITLAQRRPWEDKAEPDASTFKFKLKVS